MFNRNPPSARPIYSSPASHWVSTILVAVLMSMIPQMPASRVVEEWSALVAGLAQILEAQISAGEADDSEDGWVDAWPEPMVAGRPDLPVVVAEPVSCARVAVRMVRVGTKT